MGIPAAHHHSAPKLGSLNRGPQLRHISLRVPTVHPVFEVPGN